MSKLTDLIDSCWATRQKRMALAKEVEALEKNEKLMRDDIGMMLRAAKLDNAQGAVATGFVKRTSVATIIDEDKFLKWGALKANRDVLRVGVVTEGWRARLISGVKVPGVDTYLREDIVVTGSHKGA